MEFFKTWIAPPLVGAVIGYFTNWLAIKMLFRPLEPVYIGRFKLPFTPGILPAERRRLSATVGETVSRELLSADVFRSRLADEGLRSKIEASAASLLGSWLSRPVSPALRSLGGTDSGGEKTALGALASASIEAILGSPEFRDSLVEASGRAAEELARARLGELLSPKRFGELASDYIGNLAGPAGGERIDGLVDGLASFLEGSAQSLFSTKAVEPLAVFAAKGLYAGLIPVVESYLRSPETAAELERSGVAVVHGAIGRLNPLQRLIVGAANYERSLGETMPQTVADLTRSAMEILRRPQTEERILEALPTLLGRQGRGEERRGPSLFPLEELKPALKAFLTETAAEEGDFALRLEERYESLSQKTILELLPGLPAFLEARTRDFLVPSPLGKAALDGGVGVFLARYAESLEGRSIGQALGLGEEQVRRLASELAQAVVSALVSQADKLVEALDVKAMVVDKLDSLQMLEVEKLILNVVNKELNWITVLGGILGCLIGVFQSLLSLL